MTLTGGVVSVPIGEGACIGGASLGVGEGEGSVFDGDDEQASEKVQT